MFFAKSSSKKSLKSKEIIARAWFRRINYQKVHNVEGLKEVLAHKKVFLFVNIFSDDFRGPELDAMLSALCGKEAKVTIVVVDGIQGINLVDLEYDKLNNDEIKQIVFNKGIEEAKKWIFNNFHVISKYINLNLSVRYILCLRQMETITQFSQCEEIIKNLLISSNSSQESKQLRDAIQVTIDGYLRNKGVCEQNRPKIQRYIEIELTYYMALTCVGDFIAFTGEEPPSFKFARELVKQHSEELNLLGGPAGYVEFALKRLDPRYISENSKNEIRQTGGVSENYSNKDDETMYESKPFANF
ncbi:MAG: hypothetical protein AMJ43_03090 [Coxiella sp. DG_40]|nr:MAG: hypothetical protein AMJ43_03090 [Coxiella sp. DG_40]